MRLGLVVVLLLPCAPALAKLPMGLKCDPTVKIAVAEVGEVAEYEVQMGMKKEKHRALRKRKKVTPVDGCHFPDLKVGQTVVVRYTGKEVGETQVQCIDLNNNNAAVEFPKSIYTVRNSHIAPYMLLPYCPDGKSPDAGVTCSKLDSQSQRASEYKATVLGWGGNGKPESKNKQYLIDMVFDPPFHNSVPANAKLFCGLVNRDGAIVIAGTALYPGPGAPAAKPAEGAEPAEAE